MTLQLGDTAPDFEAETTRGPIRFHEWLGGSWGVLFSHPADFTPVCTTELGAVARLKDEFGRRGTKVLGLSVDPVESHLRWEGDIGETQGAPVSFPMIADPDRKVSALYDMIHPNASGNTTVRSVFVIGPDKKIKLTLTYPMSTGRNFAEILRAIDSLQLTEAYPVATPADWQPGQDVIIGLAVSDEQAAERFPGYRVIKPYLRMTGQPPAMRPHGNGAGTPAAVTPVPEKTAEQILGAVRALFTAQVMSHAGHANVSARLGGDRFALTTAGVVRELTHAQLAVVSLDGEVLAGALAPENAEIVAMHSAVYRARADAGAVIHTHSPAATAFALAHRPLPCRTEPLLRFGQAEPVPVVPWGPRGSDVSVRGIARTLEQFPGTSAVLLANHGLLAFGADPMSTARLVIAIEESAEAELAAAVIGGAADFPAGALDAVRAAMRPARSPGHHHSGGHH